MTTSGLRVFVQGELPEDHLARISTAVRDAVLRELAAANLTSVVVEQPVDDYVQQETANLGSDDEPGVASAILTQLGLQTGILLGGFVGTISPVTGLPGAIAGVPASPGTTD